MVTSRVKYPLVGFRGRKGIFLMYGAHFPYIQLLSVQGKISDTELTRNDVFPGVGEIRMWKVGQGTAPGFRKYGICDFCGFWENWDLQKPPSQNSLRQCSWKHNGVPLAFHLFWRLPGIRYKTSK